MEKCSGCQATLKFCKNHPDESLKIKTKPPREEERRAVGDKITKRKEGMKNDRRSKKIHSKSNRIDGKS